MLASSPFRAAGRRAVFLIISSVALTATMIISLFAPTVATSAVIPSKPPLATDGKNPYGTDGRGNPRHDDCTATVTPGTSINAAIKPANRRAVVCVRPGDYRAQTVNLDRPGVTVRALGPATIKNAVVTGDDAALDGFTVVGARYLEPRAGITFGGQRQQIVRNLVNGHQLSVGISCDDGKCNRARVVHNTVTNLRNYGMEIGSGSRSLIAWNNVYDLYTEQVTDADVDAVRFFGAHTFAHNYLHDINQFKSKADSSGDTPHVDCFQTFNGGPAFAGTVIEANLCVRVSRQCLIAQNDTAKTYAIRDLVFRNNVCETYDSQSVNLGSMKGVQLQNNLILSGFRFQVISLEQQETGLANRDTTIINNILVRAKASASTYERIGVSTGERFLNNLELLDPKIAPRDPAFQNTRDPYPAFRVGDFTAYRDYAAALPVRDRGVFGNWTTTDLAGNPRLIGRAIDLGPYELGACPQRC